MKNITGTAAYWKDALLNLLATFKSLGPPTLFVTLSANGMHWPQVIMTLQDCTYNEALRVKIAGYLVHADPLLTAMHFERCCKALYREVICGPLKPLGNITDYFARVEFQNR